MLKHIFYSALELLPLVCLVVCFMIPIYLVLKSESEDVRIANEHKKSCYAKGMVQVRSEISLACADPRSLVDGK